MTKDDVEEVRIIEYNCGGKKGGCSYDIELYTRDSDECINEFTYFEGENTAYIRMEDEWYKVIKFSQIPFDTLILITKKG